jgi:branched-chain amino acid transport system substrate-binding protein
MLTSRRSDVLMTTARPTSTIKSLILAGLLLGGCAQSIATPAANTATIAGGSGAALASPAETKARAVKIALLLPMSGFGEPAQIARGMKQAAEMALFEADNPAIQLITKDDGGTAAGALAAADAAIAEGAEIILGPLFAKSVTGAATAATKTSTPVIAFSNDPAVAGRGVYLMSFMTSEEVSRVVSFAASRGKRRFAALIPQTDYGKTLEAPFRQAVTAAGGASDSMSMLAAAKRVFATVSEAEKAGRPVDALFVPGGQETIAQLGPLLAYSGIDTRRIKLIGTSAWDVPVISRDEQLIGGWYAANDPDAWTAFSDKFRKTFGTAPPRLASLSYDAMTMAISLAALPGPERYAAANLTRPSGFPGVDGTVRLKSDGMAERGLAVLEIEKYRSVVIDAAPRDGAIGRVSSSESTVKAF